MASLEENINQAIADFDKIKEAIEEKGVPVPYDTDTSEYGDKIRSIPQGGDTPVYDSELSVDSENAVQNKVVTLMLNTLATECSNLLTDIGITNERVTAIETDIGDIDTALAEIIAMQSSYIGGDSV